MTVAGFLNALYRPGVVDKLTRLYDNDAMMPLFVRDITFDVPGRLYQASRRDGFGNEEFVEQLIEQGGTSILWGLGVPTLRNAMDWASVNYEKLGLLKPFFRWAKPIRYNNLTRGLLDANLKPASEQPLQMLTYDKIQRYGQAQQAYIAQLKASGQVAGEIADDMAAMAGKRQSHFSSFFNKVTHQIEAKGLLQNYRIKGGIKMLVASVIPAFLIAIGLPLIFQYVTRNTIDKKKGLQSKSLQMAVWQQLNQPAHAKPAAASPLATGITANTAAQPAAPFSPVFQQAHDNPAQGLAYSTATPMAKAMATTPKFGNWLNVLTKIESSEKWNTFLVDGVISGGRVVIARNIYDKLENLIQEAGAIYFLFFAAKPLQHFFGKAIDKVGHTFTNLLYNPEVAAHIYHLRNDKPKQFFQQLEQFRQQFVETDHLSKAKNGANAFESVLFNEKGLEQYLLQGKNDNLLFELAKKTGAIDMVTAKKGGPALWNYTKEVDAKGIHDLAHGLKNMIERLQKHGGTQSMDKLSQAGHRYLEKGLLRTMFGKWAVWGLGVITCSTFLAWGVPRFKQKVTEWLTGHDKFPGKFNDGRHQSLFDTSVKIGSVAAAPLV